MEALHYAITHTYHNLRTFLKWVLIALILGSTIGLIGTLFHYAIHYATQFRENHSYILFGLPFAGIGIVFLYHLAKMHHDPGTNMVLLSIRSTQPITFKMAPLIFVSTVITHLFGGSSGREGAALQLGGSCGYQLGKWLKLDEKDLTIITMCGMSAAFAALFRTPLAAAIFAMEVVSVGVMYYAALVPCTLAAIIGSCISGALKVPPTYFQIIDLPTLSFGYSIRVILLAVLCGGLSILFCIVLHFVHKLYAHFIHNHYLRAACGGIIVMLLALALQTTDYLGAGLPIIQQAIMGEVIPYAFLLKLLFTSLTLGAGFKGGEIVPCFFVGATFGCAISSLLGIGPSFGAALGMICLFCGVTNCPITSFLMSLELFGYNEPLYFMLAIAVSYMLSGYYSLYSKQKIMYSKYKPEFVNQLGL